LHFDARQHVRQAARDGMRPTDRVLTQQVTVRMMGFELDIHRKLLEKYGSEYDRGETIREEGAKSILPLP
jgi:hypothetical protein